MRWIALLALLASGCSYHRVVVRVKVVTVVPVVSSGEVDVCVER